MRYMFLIIVQIVMLTTQAHCQLEMMKDTSSNFDPQEGTYNIFFSICNHGSEVATILWSIETTPGEIELWEIDKICDPNLSFPGIWRFSTCDTNYQYVLPAGDTSSAYFLKIKTFEDFDKGIVTFRLLDECSVDATDTLVELSWKFGDSLILNTTEYLEPLRAQVHPNPTADFFSFTNDNEVASVILTDFNGQHIRTYSHNRSERHNVSDMPPGCYLLQLQDRNGRTTQIEKLIIDK